MTLDRPLPHNLSAERAILGSILLHQEALLQAASTLEPGHFYRDAHRRLFAAMQRLADGGRSIDLVTLTAELARVGDMEHIGGPAYVAALVDGMPRAANVADYAAVVREHATRRDLIASMSKTLEAAFDAEETATDLVAQAQESLTAVCGTARAQGFVSLESQLGPCLERLEWLHANKGMSGLRSGLVDLDAMTRGFTPGQLVLVAGRPSMGKTSLALNIAEYAAHPARGKKVGVFSLEMSVGDLMQRLIASQARVDSHRMQGGYLSDSEWRRVSAVIANLGELAISIDDDGQTTVAQMRAKAKRLQAEQGLDLVIVDYVQLMDGGTQSRRSDGRVAEISAISRGLKGLAKDLDVPVIALSQLSRATETRQDHRPILSDLRESGALEQDADLVLFLYRDEYYHHDSEAKGQAEVIVAKHRNGPIGTVRVRFDREFTRFDNLEQPSLYEDRWTPAGGH